MRRKTDSFILYTSMKDALLSLDDAALRRMVQAIFEYHENGKDQGFQNGLRMSWLLMKKQFDANRQAYEVKCEKMRENSLLRWGNGRENGKGMQKDANALKESKRMQIGSDNDNDNDNDFKRKVSKDTKEKKDFFLLYASEELKKSLKIRELWEGWMKDRSERRKPVTVRAAKGQWDILNGLTEEEAAEAIQEAVNKAYLTFYPKHENKNRGGEGHAQTNVCGKYGVLGGQSQDGN